MMRARWKNTGTFFKKAGMLCILTISLTGNLFGDRERVKAELQPVELPMEAGMPEEVRNWVENSLKFDLTDFANAKEFDGKQYLFVRSGTGGFRGGRLIQIIDVIVEQEEVAVKVEFTKPPLAQQIPDNLYDLVYIEATGLPVRFVPIADEAIFIASLTGIHYLPDIVAQSRTIKVFAPAPNEVVGRKFSVSGVANVFEATVLYRLLDVNQNILVDGFITAGQLASDFTRETVIPHTVLNWNYFTFDLRAPENVVTGDDLTLELYWESPQDGTRANLVAIPLKFELR